MDFSENLKRYAKVKTLSIAFPSSIFDNTPAPQLEAYLVGQLARAAVVYNACEIVIFDEEDDPKYAGRTDRLVKLFEYAECPQYLRKRLFALEPDLKFAGMINPLEAQHHLRTSQIECPYREGVTIKHVNVESKGVQRECTEVNIGLSRTFVVPGIHELGSRVTLKVDPADLKKVQSMLGPGLPDRPEALLVPPIEPLEKLNLYWGYYVRRASSLTQVLKDNLFCPGTKNKFYDLIIGTSERGVCVDDVEFRKGSKKANLGEQETKKQKSEFNHILVVFGGVKGLEHSASCDKELKSCDNLSSQFDYYINTCPNQGSTTIRTEEAVLITLSALRPKLNL